MEDLRNLEHRMDRVLAPQIANGIVTVNLGRTGLLISLSSAGFFQSGSAVPIASSLPALNEIGRAIATTPYDVRIEGHTDNVPIHNAQYSDNWELSTARATVLTRLFIEEDHILPDRLVGGRIRTISPGRQQSYGGGPQQKSTRRHHCAAHATAKLEVRNACFRENRLSHSIVLWPSKIGNMQRRFLLRSIPRPARPRRQ